MSSKNWLVTGCSRGIGLEFVKQLLERKHSVFAVVRDLKSAGALLALNPTRVFQADVSSTESLSRLARELGDETALDVLVNNAGAYLGAEEAFEKLSFPEIERSFSVNTLGPMRTAQALLPLLKKSAEPRLINITSLMGSIADNSSGGSYGYRMSKAALNMFTKCIAVDCPWLVSAALHPGWVKTDMGGPQAPTQVGDSVRGMLQTIGKLHARHSGGFFEGETGERLEW